jgi:inhibitor of cysteine peptidase
MLVLGAAWLLAGCGQARDANVEGKTEGEVAQEVTLGAEDHGSRGELSAKQMLVVRLASNPTTGYSWEVAEIDEAVLAQVGEAEFVVDDLRDPPPLGAGGTETFRFAVQGGGRTQLTLVYHRPWEEVEPLETFSVEVVVQ